MKWGMGYNQFPMKWWLLVLAGFFLLTVSCSIPQVSADYPSVEETGQPSSKATNPPDIESATIQSTLETPTAIPTHTSESTLPENTPEPTPSPAPTPTPTLNPSDWQDWPIIPQIGPVTREIFLKGQELGNHPTAFSKVGDCGSTPAWFLGDFDRGEKFYSLGEYDELVAVIDQFQGSYGRTSLAAKSGFNASSVFAPLWSNRDFCEPNETPLACEYRVHKPAFALVMLGSNDVYHLDTFEAQMRKIIEFSIENGVVPILSTKADNLEGDFSINKTMAQLANEYGIPLLNYWAAVQSLPNHGLQEDGVHITWARNFFDDPAAMKSGWTVRNLTALQMLDAVWRAINTNQ